MSAATPGTGGPCYRTGHPRQSYRHRHWPLPLENSLHFIGPVPQAWGSGPSTSRRSDFYRASRGSVTVHARRKWYAIFEPATARGVYRVWEQVKQLVSGQPNAVHKGFPNEAAALEWLLSLNRSANEKNEALEHLRRLILAPNDASNNFNHLYDQQQLGGGQLAALLPPTPASATGPGYVSAEADPDAATAAGSVASASAAPRPWETGPLVLPVATAPSREYYRKWYAVRFVEGGSPGVYNTWQDAEAAISGRYAEHRSFDAHEEALSYAFGREYAGQLQEPPPGPSGPHPHPQPHQQEAEAEAPQDPAAWAANPAGAGGEGEGEGGSEVAALDTLGDAWAHLAHLARRPGGPAQLANESQPHQVSLHRHEYDELYDTAPLVYGWGDEDGVDCLSPATAVEEEEEEEGAFFSGIPFPFPRPQSPLVQVSLPSTRAPALAAGDAAAVRPPPVNPSGAAAVAVRHIAPEIPSRAAAAAGGVIRVVLGAHGGGVGLPVSPAMAMGAPPALYDSPCGRRAPATVLPSAPLASSPSAFPPSLSTPCTAATGALSHPHPHRNHSHPHLAAQPPRQCAALAVAAPAPGRLGAGTSSSSGSSSCRTGRPSGAGAVDADGGDLPCSRPPAARRRRTAGGEARPPGPLGPRGQVVQERSGGRRPRVRAGDLSEAEPGFGAGAGSAVAAALLRDAVPSSSYSEAAEAGAAVSVSAASGRRRGRPPKSAATASAEGQGGRPSEPAAASVAVTRRRGRPPTLAPTALPKRPRGRPPKSAAAALTTPAAGHAARAGATTAGGSSGGHGGAERRRGRPPIARTAAGSPFPAVAAARRPRGRPRKQPEPARAAGADSIPSRAQPSPSLGCRPAAEVEGGPAAGAGAAGAGAVKRPRGRPRKEPRLVVSEPLVLAV